MTLRPAAGALARLGAAATVLVVVATGCAGTDQDAPDSASSRGDRGGGREQADDPGAEVGDAPRRERANPRRVRTKAPAVNTPRPAPRPPATFLVSRVIDGDTLELGTGQDVRLVGIDTPETGQCGFDKATANLIDLVEGRRVVLTRSDEDADQYGRLLRYVNIGTTDAGLRLIKNGNAIARYDSRDGYGFHQREPTYIAADRASPGVRCAPPAPVPAPAPAGGACSPGYTPCVPPFPPDVDCGGVDGPIQVTGTDPHGLDGEGDGIACE